MSVTTTTLDCGCRYPRRVASIGAGYGKDGPAYMAVCPACLAAEEVQEGVWEGRTIEQVRRWAIERYGAIDGAVYADTAEVYLGS